MPEARKKPCRICRRWFRPDPRAGGRQRACGKAECQAARRQKTRASWRGRNPSYAIAWRIDQRLARTQPPEPPEPPEPLRLPPPLHQLPWDVVKDHFRPHLIDSTGLPSALPPVAPKTSPGLPHTGTRKPNDAIGISPTRPALGTPAGPGTAPAAPPAGLAGG